MVIAARQLNDNRINTIMSEKLKSNSYCLHSENMLCAMLTDQRSHVWMLRMDAIKKIIECRRTPETTIRI